MSRSWTSAGLALGRDFVQLAGLGARGSAEVLEQRRLPTPLFSGAATAQAQEALAQALQPFGAALGRRYLPLHVSLPDAAVRYGAFELEELPKGRAARLELARFRFARDGMAAAAACACQPLQTDAGKPLLFGMALDAAWQRLLAGALAQAGLRPWSMNPHLCRQWNRFHDRLAQASGALVALSPDAWSLLLWDARGTPRYVRARWRHRGEDYAGIAQDVERGLLAYVHAGEGREVARIFAAGNGETGALGEALDARLASPCIRLEDEPAAAAAARER